MKGIAASIGASDLSEAARQLEVALVEGDGDGIEQKVDTLIKLLDITLEAIDEILDTLSSNAAPPVHKGSQTSTHEEEISKLVQLLESSDAEAVNYIDQLVQVTNGSIHTELKVVQKYIHRYDFDGALGKLQGIIQKHSPS